MTQKLRRDRDLKVFFLHRRYLLAAVTLLLTAAIFTAVNLPAAVTAAGSARQLPIYCVDRSDNTVSISFDAAWGNEDTQTLIDILAQYGVKTTFFVVGEWVEKYPESVKALHEAGHEIMNHSDHHDHYNALSAQEIIADVESCNDKIAAITGVRPTLIRCPYGEYDDHVIAAIRSIGMEPIQWDVDSLDWKDLSASEITRRVTGKVQSGSICLFHNAALHTPEALPAILDFFQSSGYRVVPISQLILTGEYYMDHTGKQCPAE